MGRRVAVGALLALGVGLLALSPLRSADASPDAVDVGFLHDMVDHHDQAVLLASIVLRPDSGASVPVRNAALDVVSSQRFEIGMMTGWLRQWGLSRGAPDRAAMAWMDMPVSVDAMPGMASAGDVAALAELTGRALDVRYLELMIEHHQGGLHMAEAARERAEDPEVQRLAREIVRNQRKEIREMQTLVA